MENVELRDGRIITLDCWDFNDFKKYTLGKIKSKQEKRSSTIFEGFSYYGYNTIDSLQVVNTDRYAESCELSVFERQKAPRLPNEDYHRAIVALHEQHIVGLLLCQWTNNRYFPFWLYHMKFVDVNREFQNLSVATHLVKQLDNVEFLHQKILYLGIFSNSGKKFLKPVCDRILHAKSYALVTSQMYMGNPPTAPGIYRKPELNSR